MNIDRKIYKFLIVEDNPGDLIIVEELLGEKILEPKIQQARSFREARELLQMPNVEFDIVLLDLSLPDKTGQELITSMLELSPGCPIIILTGSSDIEFSITSIALGISDYLLKDDLNSLTLYKSITYSIERRKTLLQLEESEKRYSDLFQMSPQPMLVYAGDTLQVLAVNKAAISHYGYSEAEFLNLNFSEINLDMSGETAGILPADEQHIFLNGVLKHRKKDGEVFFVDLHLNKVQFNGKEAVLLLANDITESLNYIAAIEEQNKKLLEIAWIQSHVVRAPLAKMMGLLNLIRELKIADPVCANLLDHLEVSGLELDAIIKDIAQKTELIDINE